VANGPNIFQMLLVFIFNSSSSVLVAALHNFGTEMNVKFVIDNRVCLSVFVSTHISETTSQNLTKFSVHVNSGCGLVLCWRCNTLCILPILWTTYRLHKIGPMAT